MDWTDELDRDTRQAIVRHADEALPTLRDGATLDPADLAALVNGYELLRALVTKAKPPGHTCPAIDRVKRGIGHGGFGEVYYATSDAGKEVALKLIRRNLDVELRGIKQCLNLKHPNLLALFDIREGGQGDNWVVMEYVGGRSLEDVVAAHPQGMILVFDSQTASQVSSRL